ncbi:MAG TPA: hypothetical protein VMZ52_07970 [Bryobacteraceae bacterium]|nr:hypothetical protein [Bryobacteraceae bacterium]
MSDLRLGDIIDDYCIKCRRLTNHSIVSIVSDEAAKVRCRSCYHDHNYQHEIAPPSKKDLKKMELFNSVLASIDPAAVIDPEMPAEPLPVDIEEPEEIEAAPEPAVLTEKPVKKARSRVKKA